MKAFISIFFFTAMLFSSCGTSQSKESKNETDQIIDQPEETNDFKEAKNCDEFIDQYEEWTDDYLKLLDSYMKNPMDATLSQKFIEQGEKASFWMNQWNGKLISCASQDKYQKRFDEISAKVEKKLEEMGIE